MCLLADSVFQDSVQGVLDKIEAPFADERLASTDRILLPDYEVLLAGVD